MCIINLIIIYDMVNMFSMKKYKSFRKLRVGVNRYMGELVEVSNHRGGGGVDSGRRVDSGGVHNLPPGYTLESTPGAVFMKGLR